ncbi:MAG: hypothetical protein PHS57_07215 [Alphaproteobacteria bacterium]|nr:hypothetical protein [Alphaproteobacteria bacterium]
MKFLGICAAPEHVFLLDDLREKTYGEIVSFCAGKGFPAAYAEFKVRSFFLAEFLLEDRVPSLIAVAKDNESGAWALTPIVFTQNELERLSSLPIAWVQEISEGAEVRAVAYEKLCSVFDRFMSGEWRPCDFPKRKTYPCVLEGFTVSDEGALVVPEEVQRAVSFLALKRQRGEKLFVDLDKNPVGGRFIRTFWKAQDSFSSYPLPVAWGRPCLPDKTTFNVFLREDVRLG